MIIARRLFFILVLPIIAFSILATQLTTTLAIELVNSVRFSLSLAVLIAYLPGVIKIVFDPAPLDRPAFLSIGIVFSWLSGTTSGAWWVAFQLMGRPASMSTNAIVLMNIFFYCIAATFHLVAPGSIHQSVPATRWIRIGMIAAVSVFAILVMSHLAGVKAFEVG